MKLLETIGGLLVFVPLFIGVMWSSGYLADERHAFLGWIARVGGMAGLIARMVG